jgi:hypothetical protein
MALLKKDLTVAAVSHLRFGSELLCPMSLLLAPQTAMFNIKRLCNIQSLIVRACMRTCV